MSETIYRILTTVSTPFMLLLGLFIYNKIKDIFYKYIVGFSAGILLSMINFSLLLVYLKNGGSF